MKFQGKYRVGCQCQYCIGPGKNKRVRKGYKHRERQDYRKEEKDGLQHADIRKEKRIR